MNLSIPYSPFGKDYKEVMPADLTMLREIAEGWYIEYKAQVVSTRNIAKSISAFANHYGGWIFYGIEESKDGSNRAGAFLGLSQNDTALLIERIRNAVKDSVNPQPYYEYKILTGPAPEINLDASMSIVMVLVAQGQNAPYIHGDGRIYRRIADSSDPKAENDRFVLDQLWRRGQDAQEKLAMFLEEEPVLSTGEHERITYAQLFLLPDPLKTKGQVTTLGFDQFVEQMSNKTIVGVSTPSDNFYSMADGFIARQVSTNDPYNLVYTWKHYRNGTSVVTIPFSSSPIGHLHKGTWLHGYKYEDDYLRVLQASQVSAGHVIDVNHLIHVVSGAVSRQRLLMETGDITGPVYSKVVVRNIWRRIPFLDTRSFSDFIQNHGIPIIQTDMEFTPPGVDFQSLLLLNDFDRIFEGDEGERWQIYNAAPIAAFLLLALGIPAKLIIPNEEDGAEWWTAGMRTIQVQQHRQNNLS